jgi:hypothetical protein
MDSLQRLALWWEASLQVRSVTPRAMHLLTISIVWLAAMVLNWNHCGTPTIDDGREMYVPWALSQGQEMYRDVWYLYTPAGPYLNSLWYRIFGAHLNTLQAAGALTVLGCGLMLYQAAIRLVPAAWAIALACLIVLQSCTTSLFNYLLPYSAGAVYGSFLACVMLWLGMKYLESEDARWPLLLSIIAFVAGMFKTEYGMAGFASLPLLWILGGWLRGWRKAIRDALLFLPGVALAAVAAWAMLQRYGGEFLARENMMSWPSHYFMRQFGQHWLAVTGLELTRPAIRQGASHAVQWALFWIAIGLLMHFLFSADQPKWRRWIGIVGGAGFAVLFTSWMTRQDYGSRLHHSVFSTSMPAMLVGFGGLAALFLLVRKSMPLAQTLWVCGFGFLVAFRILFKNDLRDYPIFYNHAVLLGMLCGVALLVGPKVTQSLVARRLIALGLVGAGLLCVLPGYGRLFGKWTELNTSVGTMHLAPHKALAYQEAIQFMGEAKRRGELSLVVPEDTGLYFLSQVQCPVRVFVFSPGVIEPGPIERKTIAEIESKKIKHVLWTQRDFTVYGTPFFGEDFHFEMAAYLKQNYRLVRPMGDGLPDRDKWRMDLWERKNGN